MITKLTPTAPPRKGDDEVLATVADAGNLRVRRVRRHYPVLPDGLPGVPVLGHRALRRGTVRQEDEARSTRLRLLRGLVHGCPDAEGVLPTQGAAHRRTRL